MFINCYGIDLIFTFLLQQVRCVWNISSDVYVLIVNLLLFFEDILR